MDYTIWVIGVLLLIFAIIDLKFKKIPSVFLTGIIFVLAVIHADLFYFGVLSLIYAFLLREFNFIGGIADIKVIVMIGLMISNIGSLFIFMAIVVIYGTIWKVIVKWLNNKRNIKDTETAFLPVLFFTYLALAITGMI